MDKDILSELIFEQYLVEKIEFLLNKDFELIEDIQLDLDFDREIDIDLEDGEATIKLECKVFKNYKDDNKPFYLEVVIIGFFKFKGDLSESKIENLLEINGTAILFPYLRSLISTITINSGLPALTIPLINIVKMLEKR